MRRRGSPRLLALFLALVAAAGLCGHAAAGAGGSAGESACAVPADGEGGPKVAAIDFFDRVASTICGEASSSGLCASFGVLRDCIGSAARWSTILVTLPRTPAGLWCAVAEMQAACSGTADCV